MKKVAFTICSNNYLAQAKVLLDSLKKYNPEYIFIIGLCDKKDKNIDYSAYNGADIIEIENINIRDLNYMIYNYNIIEFNTAVKPFMFRYIFDTYKADLVCYFDPDTCVYDSLESIESEINGSNILLTPHICSPIPLDNKIPQENIFLNYGLYNLGFIALNKNEETDNFIAWWSERLQYNCLINEREGKFVDQLPINFVPIFFDKVVVSYNLGLNVAYWNFHERNIDFINGKYIINNKWNLMFFHFSNYKPKNKDIISPFFTRFGMDYDTTIKQLYNEYYNRLMENDFNKLHIIPCFYVEERFKKQRTKFVTRKILKSIIPNSLRRKIKSIIQN